MSGLANIRPQTVVSLLRELKAWAVLSCDIEETPYIVRLNHLGFYPMSGSEADNIADNLNEIFDRLAYIADNPDASLQIVDSRPTLTGDGIDHEVLFRLGS